MRGMASTLLGFAMAGLLTGCADEPTPEARIRGLIAEAEQAAEARDTGDVMAFVASDYRDERGHTPEDLRNYLRGLFLRYQSVHLLVRVEAIRVQETEASSTLFVAMAGQPITEANAFMLRADVHRLDLAWQLRDGEWQVTGAAWRRAAREDLLGAAAAH